MYLSVAIHIPFTSSRKVHPMHQKTVGYWVVFAVAVLVVIALANRIPAVKNIVNKA